MNIDVPPLLAGEQSWHIDVSNLTGTRTSMCHRPSG